MNRFLKVAAVVVVLFVAGCKTEAQRRQEEANKQVFVAVLVLCCVAIAAGRVWMVVHRPDLIAQERELAAQKAQQEHERSQKNKELASTFAGPIMGVAGALVKRGLGS